MKRIPNMGERYYITTTGRLYTKARNRTNANKPLHEFKIQTNNKGYKTAVLKADDGKKHSYQIHRLVYSTFVGDIPTNYQIDHIDNNKTNNKLSNLRLATNQENINYKVEFYRANPYIKECILCSNKFETPHKIAKYCTPRCRSKDFAIKFKEKNGYWQPSMLRTQKRLAIKLNHPSLRTEHLNG